MLEAGGSHIDKLLPYETSTIMMEMPPGVAVPSTFNEHCRIPI
jgi:hypothetical protein